MAKHSKKARKPAMKHPAPATPSTSFILSPRWEPFLAGVIFLIGLSLRLVHLFESKGSDPFFAAPSVDSNVYYEWAQTIVQGNGEAQGVFFQSPLYPYFLALLFFCFGEGFVGPRIVHALLGALSGVLVFFIGKRVFDARVGLIAGLLQATHLVSIYFESLFLVGAIQIPLLLGLLLVLAVPREQAGVVRMAVAGLLLGLAALARPDVLLFGGFVVGWLLFAGRDVVGIARRAATAGVFCVAALGAILPATLHNVRSGDAVLISTQAGANFYIGNGRGANGMFNVPPDFSATDADDPVQQREVYARVAQERSGRALKPSEVSAFWLKEGLSMVAAHPLRWMGLVRDKFLLFFNHYEIYNSGDFYSAKAFSTVLRLPLPTFGIIGVLGLLGMVASLGERRRAGLLYAMAATHLLTALLFFVVARYRLPAVPVLAIFAGCAVVRAREALETKDWRRIGIGFAVLVAASVLVLREPPARMNEYAVHFNLANRLRNAGRHEQADAEYRAAAALNSGYISTFNNMALNCEAAKRMDCAKESWEKVRSMAQAEGNARYVERADRHLTWLNRGEFPPAAWDVTASP